MSSSVGVVARFDGVRVCILKGARTSGRSNSPGETRLITLAMRLVGLVGLSMLRINPRIDARAPVFTPHVKVNCDKSVAEAPDTRCCLAASRAYADSARTSKSELKHT